MRLLLVCAGVLLGAAPGLGLRAHQAAPSPSGKPLYVNREYGFSVRVPPNLKYDRTMPPNPDHGFGITLAEHEKLWVDASLTESPSIGPEVDRVVEGCHVQRKQKTLLNGHPATSLQVECPATAYNGAYEERVVLVDITMPGRSPILYQVGLRTDAGRNSAAGVKAFEQVVAGFVFERAP